MGPICCPETSVINYQYSLRNNQEQRSFDIDNLPPIFEKHKFHPNRIFNKEGNCITTLPSKLPKSNTEQLKKIHVGKIVSADGGQPFTVLRVSASALGI
jgi:hypothetical protein